LKCDEDLFSFEAEEQNGLYLPKVIVARRVNGISLNTELEYLLDSEGDEIIFENQAKAEAFLLNAGFGSEDLEYFYFIEFENEPGAELTLLKIGDRVRVFEDCSITGAGGIIGKAIGEIVGNADDEYENFPDIERGAYDDCFVVDFGEEGTRTVHAKNIVKMRGERQDSSDFSANAVFSKRE